MNYKIDSITNRAQESKLWSQLETQSGDALPYLLERYLLLENWRYRDRLEQPEGGCHSSIDTIQFLHSLMAEAVTVLLSQEERIRNLEASVASLTTSSAREIRDKFAGMALMGMLCANAQTHEAVTDKNVDAVIAREAYLSADAMIAERAKP